MRIVLAGCSDIHPPHKNRTTTAITANVLKEIGMLQTDAARAIVGFGMARGARWR